MSQAEPIAPDIWRVLEPYMKGGLMNCSPSDGFFWEYRSGPRGIIELNEDTVARARKIRYSKNYRIQVNHKLPQVLHDLADPSIKPKSWMNREAQAIYHKLHDHGFARTYEAYDGQTLAGAVLGVDLDPVFVADTMYFRPGYSGASKACLVAMILDLHARHYAFVDTQSPHPATHPAAKIGERSIPMDDFCSRMALLCKRHFPTFDP